MTTAREEAERRYFGPLGFVSADMVSEESASQREVLAFVAGVEYQAVQPVEITDAMVERGARSDWERHLQTGDPHWEDVPFDVRATYKVEARATLEAALGGEA
jgi:hypothetical protein